MGTHSERFEIDINFLFFSFIRQDGSTVNDQTIIGYFRVEFESLLSRGNRGEYGESVHSGFNVGRGTVLLGQHGGQLRDL